MKISNGVNLKKIQGQVISEKMDKTVVVRVTTRKTHPKYHKPYLVHKPYPVHDEKQEYHIGDVVEIAESRPLSKQKRWKVVRKIK